MAESNNDTGGGERSASIDCQHCEAELVESNFKINSVEVNGLECPECDYRSPHKIGDESSYRGKVKCEFDCGHWILIPTHFACQQDCPLCGGEFVQEVAPDNSDFEEATWT